MTGAKSGKHSQNNTNVLFFKLPGLYFYRLGHSDSSDKISHTKFAAETWERRNTEEITIKAGWFKVHTSALVFQLRWKWREKWIQIAALKLAKIEIE